MIKDLPNDAWRASYLYKATRGAIGDAQRDWRAADEQHERAARRSGLPWKDMNRPTEMVNAMSLLMLQFVDFPETLYAQDRLFVPTLDEERVKEMVNPKAAVIRQKSCRACGRHADIHDDDACPGEWGGIIDGSWIPDSLWLPEGL